MPSFGATLHIGATDKFTAGNGVVSLLVVVGLHGCVVVLSWYDCSVAIVVMLAAGIVDVGAAAMPLPHHQQSAVGTSSPVC